MTSPKNAELRRHVSRFVVIGVCSVAADFVAYRLLMIAGLSPHLAKALSYFAGMAIGYVGNKTWTFESKRRSVSEPVTFIALYLTTMAINVLINGAILSWFGQQALLPAYLIATAVSTVLNFLGLRTFTFRAGVQQARQMRIEAFESA